MTQVLPEPIESPLLGTVPARARRHRWTRRARIAGAIAVGVLLVGVPIAVKLSGSSLTDALGGLRPMSVAERAHRSAAIADVPRLLSAFSPPPGAKRAGRGPDGAALVSQDQPKTKTGTRWWTVRSSLPGVTAWLRAHIPPPASADVTGSGPGQFMIEYDWPDIAGVLANRTVTVQATAGGARVAIEAVASATWLPARSAAATIPASVHSITAMPADGSGPKAVTDPIPIASVVTLVNGLPVATPEGKRSCPGATGGTLDLAFADGAGHVTQRLTIALSGCQSITIVAANGTSAELADPDGATALGAQISTILGLDG